MEEKNKSAVVAIEMMDGQSARKRRQCRMNQDASKAIRFAAAETRDRRLAAANRKYIIYIFL